MGGELVRGADPAAGRGAGFFGLGLGLAFALVLMQVPAQGQEVTSALGTVFVGVDGFDQWESGLVFVAALKWGPFWLVDFQAVEKLRAFGLHAGWKFSPAWLAVGVRVLNEERRGKTKTIWQVGARAGGRFELIGILSWYNEAGAYMPLGERGDLMPFVALGVSLSF